MFDYQFPVNYLQKINKKYLLYLNILFYLCIEIQLELKFFDIMFC